MINSNLSEALLNFKVERLYGEIICKIGNINLYMLLERII